MCNLLVYTLNFKCVLLIWGLGCGFSSGVGLVEFISLQLWCRRFDFRHSNFWETFGVGEVNIRMDSMFEMNLQVISEHRWNFRVKSPVLGHCLDQNILIQTQFPTRTLSYDLSYDSNSIN